ncbi:GNAT family N-acetyltransferase [Haloarchaeobius iranensis]|uniref:Acetyltransferase (GNAT) domain-containing protein n=1 Tax=Haloarchaeobius iranensis TaxID=996166 RepID=A0A1G9WWM5_9EURY|nr:GNAT family N-acetyltransferase [Haloarchaeobius iranensis]SDM88503.1 Acetyltransferase (GNAT) domain-containing protein [Haloarchaeobius iranensis]
MADADESPTYDLREGPPSPERFVELRDTAGMSHRTIEAAREGVPNSYYAVRVVAATDDAEPVVGMGRVVGDGGTVFQLTDIVVHPDHQGRGLGTEITDALVTHLRETAPESAYVNLMADVEGFYERWGFEYTAPDSQGMFIRIGEE